MAEVWFELLHPLYVEHPSITPDDVQQWLRRETQAAPGID
jgi:hypothetical protein